MSRFQLFRPAPRYSARTLVFIEFIVLVGFVGCGASTDDSDATAVSQASAAEEAADDEDVSDELFVDENPIEVPDGTPAELFAFMEQVELDVLGARDAEDEIEDTADATEDGSGQSAKFDENQARALLRVMNARIAACDKILEKQAPDVARTRALRIRLDALRTLAALDPKHRTAAFNEFADKLIAGNDPLISRIAQSTKFQSSVNQFISTGAGNRDTLLADLRQLLDDPDAGPEVLAATRDAASWIFRAGDVETATQAYRMIGQTFRNHADDVVASEARHLLTQAINNELTDLIQEVDRGQPDAEQRLMTKLEELLQREDEDSGVLPISMQTAHFFEFTGRVRGARRAYQMILRRYEDDPERADLVKQSVELANRRLDLLGKELVVDGVLLDGTPFDWRRYQGKPVLVCFWTSWYTNWLDEVQTIRSAIAEHAPELQVVLINLDDDRNLAERFLQQHPMPWPVVVSPDPGIAGFENENAKRCGVEAVPFSILVGADGNVVDIHVMGPRLADALSGR